MTVLPASPKHTFTVGSTQHHVYHISQGEGLPKHEHTYSHVTICHAGSIVIRKEGREYIFTKNSQPANLAPNEWHEIEALEDGTVFENIFKTGAY